MNSASKSKGPAKRIPNVFDNGDIDLFKIAYDFEFETETRIDPGLRAELFEIVEEWQKRHQSEELLYLIFTKSMDFEPSPTGGRLRAR